MRWIGGGGGGGGGGGYNCTVEPLSSRDYVLRTRCFVPFSTGIKEICYLLQVPASQSKVAARIQVNPGIPLGNAHVHVDLSPCVSL